MIRRVQVRTGDAAVCVLDIALILPPVYTCSTITSARAVASTSHREALWSQLNDHTRKRFKTTGTHRT